MGTAALLLLALIAAAVLYRLLRKRSAAGIKGAEGERRVSKELKRIGFPSFNDIYLPTDDGATQIDHVVRVGNAIVVIETKTYSGAVYGASRDKMWRQSFRRGQNTSFQNPIHQNYKHVLAVRAVAGAAADVRNLVAMAGDAKFPKGMPEGVVALTDLAQHLREAMVSPRQVSTGEAAWAKLATVAGQHAGRHGKALHQKALAAKVSGGTL